MSDPLLITTLLLLPLAVGLLLPLVGAAAAVMRSLALATMAVVLAIGVFLFAGFDGSAAAGARHALELPWMPSLGVSLHFAVDGVNVYFVLLTTLLFPVVLLCAWRSAEGQQTLYLSLLLLLEAALLGTFLAQDLVLLFIAWETVLVPALLLILVYGGEQRRKAAVGFFLYTMAGSVFFLAAVILLGVEHLQATGGWSFDIDSLSRLHLTPGKQGFVFVALALACAVKSPLVPFHSWLPLAYAEASVSGRALMAGLMSKMGAFGFIKLVLPLAPEMSVAAAPWILLLAVISILYGAVLALRQADPRRLVAYASLSHMGYIVLGVFSFQATGIHGALLQVLSHGLAVSGLFLLLGLIEQRGGAEWLRLDALAIRTPRLAVVVMLVVLASLALPLTSGFSAEFLVLLGAFTQGLAQWRAGAGIATLLLALAASLGVVLGATYMLRMARALLFGPAPQPGSARLADLNLREGVALAPLLALILWVGVWPAPMMAKVEPVAQKLAAPTSAPGAAAGRTAQAADASAGLTSGRNGHGL